MKQKKSEALADDKLMGMLKSAAFKCDIDTVITKVKDCNQTWKQATQGMQGKVEPQMTQLHSTVSSALVRFSEPLRGAVVELHEAFMAVPDEIKWIDSEEGTSLDELMTLNDVDGVNDLVTLVTDAFASLALDVVKAPVPGPVIALTSVSTVARHILNGIVQKASIPKILGPEKCLRLKLQTLEHCNKAVAAADEMLAVPEVEVSHGELNLLKASAVQIKDEVFQTVGQHRDVITKVNASLLSSSVSADDDKYDFWPKRFASVDFYDRSREKPSSEEIFEIAIGLAQLREDRFELVKLQCLAHSDRAQRACLEFKRAIADLKGVSETELKNVTFESGAFKHFKDLDLKVGALRSFVFPLEQVHKTPLEEQLKLRGE